MDGMPNDWGNSNLVVAFFLNGPRRGEYLRLDHRPPEYYEPLPLAADVTMSRADAVTTSMVRAVYRMKGSPRPRPGGWEQDYEFVGVRL